jgi:hypothetical protein
VPQAQENFFCAALAKASVSIPYCSSPITCDGDDVVDEDCGDGGDGGDNINGDDDDYDGSEVVSVDTILLQTYDL